MCDVMIERGQQPDIITYTILMDGYCRNNEVDKARNLFDMVIERGFVPDVWSYNILIKGYVKIKRVDEALSLMKSKNIVPNIITNNSLVDGLCKAGRISHAWEIVTKMHYCGQPSPDVNTYNIFLDYLCKNQHLDEAIKLFKRLMYERSFVPNVWSYNILIRGYCQSKRLDEAKILFQDMRLKNLDPNIMSRTYSISFVKVDYQNREALDLQLEDNHNLSNAVASREKKKDDAQTFLEMIIRWMASNKVSCFSFQVDF
ncbi:hypothetical protein Ahy_B08g092575 [Arachis hypogaea]|uniref:Pentatricopeptide repeat-containing protein n=1 Tax=Arachis hypogaea TaxID=3818 RepID=A0A444Y435_ARAHY|nr:hypothetical protein Ahy_B08g092575 [Arachis hypogaea]